MMKKAVTILIILVACMVGFLCGIGVSLLISNVIPMVDPSIVGIAFGLLGVFTPLIGYILIRPNFSQIYIESFVFGQISMRIYFFFIFLGMSPVFINISISALFY